MFSNGNRANTAYFSLRFIRNGEQLNSRFGFIVGKKVDKKATQRNLVKRRLRSIIQTHIKELNEEICFDVVIIAYEKINEMQYNELEISLLKTLRHNKILKSSDV